MRDINSALQFHKAKEEICCSEWRSYFTNLTKHFSKVRHQYPMVRVVVAVDLYIHQESQVDWVIRDRGLLTKNFLMLQMDFRSRIYWVKVTIGAYGREIAVKQLKIGGGQGEREFKAEVETISRVHHRHLVSLDGYCIFENQRMLVYDNVPNTNLYFHLLGRFYLNKRNRT